MRKRISVVLLTLFCALATSNVALAQAPTPDPAIVDGITDAAEVAFVNARAIVFAVLGFAAVMLAIRWGWTRGRSMLKST